MIPPQTAGRKIFLTDLGFRRWRQARLPEALRFVSFALHSPFTGKGTRRTFQRGHLQFALKMDILAAQLLYENAANKIHRTHR